MLLPDKRNPRTMEPHVYKFNRFLQALYFAMGVAIIGMAVYETIRTHFGMALIALLFSIPGILCCSWAVCPRLILSDTEISVRNVFSESSAQRSDLETWCTDSGGNSGQFWILQGTDSSDSLRISQNFAVDDYFFDFLDKLRCLDELEISIAPK